MPTFKHHLRALLAAALLAAIALPAVAQNIPNTGLGQSWPNSPNVSASPHWNVYVFRLKGVTYYQVNDLDGGVHMAVAVEGGRALALPVGVDASRVVTGHLGYGPANSRASSATRLLASPGEPAETVYQDGSVTIAATTPLAGMTTFSVAVAPCSDPVSCVGGR